MPIPNQKLNRELKSGSDFEQWLAEINLFAHETLAELHEVAGLLNVALAGGHSTPTLGYPARESQVHAQSEQRAPLSSSPARVADESSDDPLVILQNKIARQLRASSLPTSPPETEHTNVDAMSARNCEIENSTDKPDYFYNDRPY